MKFIKSNSFLKTTMSTAIVAVTLFSPVANALVSTGAVDIGHDCLIEPFVITEVGSSTQGIVSRLLADRGATVKRGQAIAQLESAMEQAATMQAEARTEMLGEVVTREADLELAQLDSKRFTKLHAKGLAPDQQRDEAVAREKIAFAALEQAKENQKLLLLELDRTRRVLAQRTIKSPVDGVIVNQLVFAGELVFDNPIMTVAQLDPLRVEVVLPARLFGSIKHGDVAEVHSEIETAEPLVARVDVVDPLLDSRSGTFGIRLLLPNPDLDIPAGQKCRVNFKTDREGAMLPVVNPGQSNRVGPGALGAAVPYDAEEKNTTD